MANWTNEQIENSLIKMIGKLALGLATAGTMNCIKIACNEIDTRIANNSEWRVSAELAMIAKKARAMSAR